MQSIIQTFNIVFKMNGGGGGLGRGRQGFVDRGFWTKLGMDYRLLTSSPLDSGFDMASG